MVSCHSENSFRGLLRRTAEAPMPLEVREPLRLSGHSRPAGQTRRVQRSHWEGPGHASLSEKLHLSA